MLALDDSPLEVPDDDAARGRGLVEGSEFVTRHAPDFDGAAVPRLFSGGDTPLLYEKAWRPCPLQGMSRIEFRGKPQFGVVSQFAVSATLLAGSVALVE